MLPIVMKYVYVLDVEFPNFHMKTLSQFYEISSNSAHKWENDDISKNIYVEVGSWNYYRYEIGREEKCIKYVRIYLAKFLLGLTDFVFKSETLYSATLTKKI